MPKRSRKPSDSNALAAAIMVEATKPENAGKNPAAVALGRLGGLKGGKARANKLSPARRQSIAREAAAKRWGHKTKGR